MIEFKSIFITVLLAAAANPAMAERLDGDAVACVSASRLDLYVYSTSNKKYDISDALLATGQCTYLPDGAFLSVISKGGGMLHVDYRGRRLFISSWTNMK